MLICTLNLDEVQCKRKLASELISMIDRDSVASKIRSRMQFFLIVLPFFFVNCRPDVLVIAQLLLRNLSENLAHFGSTHYSQVSICEV